MAEPARSSRSRCAPGSAASPCARGCCCAGDGGLGRVEPVPGVRRRRSPSRGCAAPRRRPPATGRRRCATAVPVNVTVPGRRRPSGAHAIVPRRRLPHRQGQGRRARADASPTTQARLEAVRDALGPRRPDPGRRQRRLWSSTRRSPRSALLDRAAGGLEYVEQPCADGRGPGRRTAPGRRPDRRRRVDPPGRGPLPGARPRGRRRRGAQGAAARRGARLPADRRGHRPAGRGVRRAGDLASGSPPGVALAAALPELPYACGLATVQLLTDDVAADAAAAGRRRAAGRRPDGRRRRALDALRAPRPTGWRTGGPGWPRYGPCGRIAGRDASTALGRAVRRRAGRAAASARSCSRPGSRNAPLAFAAYDAAEAGWSGCTPASTSGPPASSRSG